MKGFFDRLKQEGLVSATVEKNGRAWTLESGDTRRRGTSEALSRVKDELLKKKTVSRRSLLIGLGVVIVVALVIMVADPNIARYYGMGGSVGPAASDPGAADAAILSDAALSSLSPDALLVELFRSVEQQNAARVENILELGADVDGRDQRGDTPLLAALKAGDGEMAAILLDHGADPNAANNRGITPLMRAASFGLTGIMDRLAESGADVKAVDRTGRTALHYAARSGTVGAIRKLVKWKVPVNGRDKGGDTPLLAAVRSNQGAAVAALLEASADPNAGTPLVVAAAQGREAMVRDLLAAGADLNGKDAGGKTPLEAAVAGNRVPVIRILFEHAREKSLRLKGDRRALEMALAANSQDVARELVAAGVRLPLPDLPMNAGAAGRWQAYRMLLREQIGADAAKKQDAALLKAAREGNQDGIRQALAAGADPDATDADGATGVLLAVQHNQPAALQLLLDAGAGPEGKEHKTGETPLTVAAALADPRPAERLLAAGANPNRPNTNGYTALDVAFGKGNRLVIPVLVSGGCRAATENNINRWTPLEFVIAADKKDMLDLLMRNSGDLDKTDSNGWTALVYAVFMNQPQLVQKLIAAGADVDARDRQEWNPLHVAVLTGNQDILDRLLAAKAKVNRRTAQNVSPVHLAAALGRGKLVAQLVKAGAKDRYRADADLKLGDRKIQKGETVADTVRRLRKSFPGEPVFQELARRFPR